MISISSIVRQYLIVNGTVLGHVGKVQWASFIAFMPDDPNTHHNIVVFYDTDPVLDGRDMVDGAISKKYGCQIALRCLVYQDGFSKLHAICDVLSSLYKASVQVDGADYVLHNVNQVSGPFFAGGVEAGGVRRNIFTANFTVTIE